MSAFTFLQVRFSEQPHTPVHNCPTSEIRIAAPLPLEQFLPTDPPEIDPLPNLEPTGGLIRQAANRQLTFGIRG